MILVIASSTARVTDLHSAAENPNVSVKRSIAARTTHSILGSLRSSTFNNRSPLMRRRPLGPRDRRKVIVGDLRRPLGKIIRGPQIPSQEPHLAGDIGLQQRLAILITERAVHADGCRSRDGSDLPQLLVALLESKNRAA